MTAPLLVVEDVSKAFGLRRTLGLVFHDAR